MNDDVTLKKSARLRRFLARVVEEYQGNPRRLAEIATQDAIVLNLMRACEAAIDLALHRISKCKLGVPQNNRHAFEILLQKRVIGEDTCGAMKRMIRFRNVAVHDFEKLQLPVLQSILEKNLFDFETFLSEISSPTPLS